MRKETRFFKSFSKLIMRTAFAGEAATNYRLGNNNMEQMKFKAAIKCYEKAIGIEPHYADAYHGLGVVYAKMGILPKSMHAFETAARIYPNLINSHIDVGDAYGNRDKFDEAIGEYGKAIKFHPNYLDTLNKLGLVYAVAGRPLDSTLHYEKAIKTKKNIAIIHFKLSAIHEKQGKFEEAITEFKKAMKINPDNDSEDVHNILAELYKKAGKNSEAQDELEIAKLMKV